MACYSWLVRPPGRYLNDDSEMKLVMETRLFVIHRLTTRHSSDKVRCVVVKEHEDVIIIALTFPNRVYPHPFILVCLPTSLCFPFIYLHIS